MVIGARCVLAEASICLDGQEGSANQGTPKWIVEWPIGPYGPGECLLRGWVYSFHGWHASSLRIHCAANANRTVVTLFSKLDSRTCSQPSFIVIIAGGGRVPTRA